MTKSKLVTFATQTRKRAELLKKALGKEKIKCILEEPDYKYDVDEEIFKVRVKTDDYEKAMEVAREINDSEGKEEIKIPEEKLDIDKIMVPVVFKDYSIKACKFALEMAIKVEADILLFHSYFNPFNNPAAYTDDLGSSGFFDKNVGNIEEKAREKMEKLVADLEEMITKKEANTSVDYELQGGEIFERMVEAYKRYQPDVIITGTKGKNKKHNDLIGRFTTKIVEKTDIPVIAVPENTTIESLEHIEVLYLTRFDESDYTALRSITTFLAPFYPKIHCLHLGKYPEKAHMKNKKINVEEFFEKYYNQTNINFDIIKEKNVIQGLQSYISENNINLLSITHHKKSKLLEYFHRDLTKKVLFYTQVPLLVFHA